MHRKLLLLRPHRIDVSARSTGFQTASFNGRNAHDHLQGNMQGEEGRPEMRLRWSISAGIGKRVPVLEERYGGGPILPREHGRHRRLLRRIGPSDSSDNGNIQWSRRTSQENLEALRGSWRLDENCRQGIRVERSTCVALHLCRLAHPLRG